MTESCSVDAEVRKLVAQTIIAQLGGSRFIRMTGARYFLALDRGVRFLLDDDFAKDGINRVEICLTPADLYDVSYQRIDRGVGDAESYCRTIATAEGLYFDQLAENFERNTGLYLSL